jgi:glucose-1-phosphate adenylyltransferase
MNDTRIGRNAVVNRAIVDKNVVIGRVAQIGYGDDYTANNNYPFTMEDGLTVVGKGSRVPSEVRIGRNCVIGSGVTEDAFANDFVASGSVLQTHGA